MLSCSDLQCERGERVLFSGLGFTLLPGCLLLVKGENGSGKSSLLKILGGVLKPSAGQVFHEEGELLYVGHKNAINPDLTVRDNIMFWCGLHSTLELGEAAISYLGLEVFETMPCRELSAGWQRRVGLARLMTIPASIWLLDEPMTHLDDDGAARVAALIESKCSSGGIVIMVTHEDYESRNLSLAINDFYSCGSVES